MLKTKFKKGRPNPYQFSLVPESLWNPNKPFPALVMSRILAGVSFREQTYSTTTGRELVIPVGASWLSLETIREDLSSAMGQIIPRHKIKYAVSILRKWGALTSKLMEPETMGRYGLLFSTKLSLSGSQKMIDPVQEYRIHAYGKVGAFVHGGVAHSGNGVEWIQRQPADIMKLIEYTARRGNPDSLFRTVGLWRRRRDVREIGKPVFLPWIVLDIDVPGSIPDAFEATLKILDDMEDAGFDLDRCFNSFSGSKGFHIAISTDQIGSPIFRDSDNARECLVRFVQDITSHNFDPSTLSPLQMLRLTGTCHQKTGFYKRTWDATTFRSMKLHTIMEASKTFEPWTYPDPRIGEIETEVQDVFETAAKAQAVVAWERLKYERDPANQTQGWNRPGPSLKAALQGVVEGEDWGMRSGRDFAGFTLACYCFTHHEQHKIVRQILNLPLAEEEYDESFESIRETINEWNTRNTPPLLDREISQKVGSAERYLQRRNKI